MISGAWVPSDRDEAGSQRAACPECPGEPQVPQAQPCSSPDCLSPPAGWVDGPLRWLWGGGVRPAPELTKPTLVCTPVPPKQPVPCCGEGAGLIHTHPAQRFPPASRGCSTDTPRQKLGLVFLFKNKANSRFLWQPSLSTGPPILLVAMQGSLRGQPPHAPQPPTSPHTPLMAAPPPDYRGPREIMINNDRSNSGASIPCPRHAGLAPAPGCGPRCSGSRPRRPWGLPCCLPRGVSPGLLSPHPYVDMVPPAH